MNLERKAQFLGELAGGNYFLQLPDHFSGNGAISAALSKTGLKYIDRSSLDNAVASILLEPRENWPSLEPDVELLDASDPTETRRVAIEVSKRKILIQAGLRETKFGSTNNEAKIEAQNQTENRTNLSSKLSPHIKDLPVVKEQQWTLINQAAQNGGVLIVGETPAHVRSPLFRILKPEIPSDIDVNNLNEMNSLVRKQKFKLLRQVVRDLKREESIKEEQAGIQIERDQFEWIGNPLIVSIRRFAGDTIKKHAQECASSGVSEFDLATQIMMHAAAFDAKELWTGQGDVVTEIEDLIIQNDGVAANELFERALREGKIKLNAELIDAECARQAQNLEEYYQRLEQSSENGSIKLPAKRMGDPVQNPFKDITHPEADARKRKIDVDPNTGEKTLTITERYSGRQITFKPISHEVSMLYSKGFSNLHYAREGEIAAYGAFLEDEDLPFAYSSYSPITRGYTMEMLTHLGIDPSTILESTRAWNASWAPENTMSILFSYSHERLKERREREIEAKTTNHPLEGVITSINPNLGFKAVSFRGVRFNVAGIKPTEFSYLKNTQGLADFMPKNVIKQILGLVKDSDLEKNPRFLANRIPFLPTLEFLTLFDSAKEQNLLGRPIYRVTDAAMKKG